MNKPTRPVVSRHATSRGSLQQYVSGYLLSLCLTVGAYLLVTRRAFSSENVLFGVVVCLALIQFFVQLYYFLHLGRETRTQWKLVVFSFMFIMVVILVGGSLWIMTDLNSRMQLSTQQMENYMNNQDGL